MFSKCKKLIQTPFVLFIIPAPLMSVLCAECIAQYNMIGVFTFFIHHLYLFMLNLMIAILIWLGITVIIRNKMIASSILFIASVVLGFISRIKIEFRNTGPLPSDFTRFGEAVQMRGVLPSSILFSLLITCIIFAVFFILILPHIHLPIWHTSKRVRIGIISAAVLIFLVPAYSQTIGNLLYNGSYQSAKDTGTFYYFFLHLKTIDIELNQSLSPDINLFEQMIQKSKKENNSDKITDEPDIIVIQSESFMDPMEIFNKNDFSSDPVAFYHTLKKQSDAFALNSPIYGGDTANAEFEVLTGISITQFPEGSNPFIDNINTPKTSLGSVLHEHGYYTHAMHPFAGTYYMRKFVYPFLGFDRFESIESMKESDPQFDNQAYTNTAAVYVSDLYLTDRIISALDNGNQQKQFIFAISMQNHVPFGNNSRHYGIKCNPNLGNIGATNELNHYLNGLAETDAALKKLVDFLKQRNKSTILVFYGDHQPRLEIMQNNSMQNKYDDLSKHEVPAIIWSNKKTLASNDEKIDMTGMSQKILFDAGIQQLPDYYFLLEYLNHTEKISAFTYHYMIKNKKSYDFRSNEYRYISQYYKYIKKLAWR